MENQNDFHETIKQGRKALDRCKRIVVDCKRIQREWWIKLAGPDLPSLLKSPAEAVRFLHHPNRDLRFVAMDILWFHWNATNELKIECERLMLDDPDPQIRAVAAGNLGHCYDGTNDPRIGKLLATVVYEEGEGNEVRISAYLALLALRTPSQEWENEQISLLTRFRFPEDVDWSFVDSFLMAEGA